MNTKSKGKKQNKNAEQDNVSESQIEVPLNESIEIPSQLHTQGEPSNVVNCSDFAKHLAEALKTPEVRKGFNDMLKPYIQSEIQKLTTPLETKLEQINDKFEGFELDSSLKKQEFEEKVKLLETQQAQVMSSILDLERKQKSCNVKITGINISNSVSSPEEKQSTYKESLMQILTKANITGVELKDIHSVSFVKGQDHSYAIVSLQSEQIKNNLYFQRTKMKKINEKVYINEDLTREDSKIFKKAREEVKMKKLHSAWTKHGRVYGKLSDNGKPFIIDS